jgi:glycosyltransferase involved in cell wall biosynthesis
VSAVQRPLISIVTPTYNESLNVEECYRVVKTIFEGQLADCDYEHVFADNASQDGTQEILRRLAKQDPRVKVVLNARNFGPFRSNFNALRYAKGDAVLVQLAADLQDPPELIPEFVAKWREGYEVVYGIRAKRQESFTLKSIRRIYYRLVARLADVHIPVDAGEFQLVDRRVVEELVQIDDYYPYIRGMIADLGFRSTGIPFEWRARKRGISSNNLYRLIDQGLNGFVSFTNIPLRLATFTGFIISGLTLLYAFVQLIVNAVYYRRFSQPGIATLIVGLFFFGGVQLFFIGILGEYINAIHSQVRRKGRVVEREKLNIDQ